MIREVVQEVLSPAPGDMADAVDKQEGADGPNCRPIHGSSRGVMGRGVQVGIEKTMSLEY